MRPIPFARPDYGEEEAEAVAAVVRSGWTTTGQRAAEFEEQFRRYVGAEHCVALNSCTAGLHLALLALGIGPGDEVITSPLTFCSTVHTIVQVGATPVLADVGDDLNLCPKAVERALTPRTRAIIPVHLGGLPCDMEALWALARRHNLKVIEDAAHAVGARVGPQPIGAGPSDIVAFSFYATKNLSMGEGGAITTGDEALAKRIRLLARHGISRDAWLRRAERQTCYKTWHYDVVDCGWKCNLSDLQAALGLVQLRRLDGMNARRAAVARRYTEAFAHVPGLQTAPEATGRTNAWHLYTLRLNGLSRDAFLQHLADDGIEGSLHFIPVPEHSYYARILDGRDPCTHALHEAKRMLSLPLYPSLTDEEVAHVINAVTTLAMARAA